MISTKDGAKTWTLPNEPRAAFSRLWDPEGDPGSALKDLVVGNTHSHKMPERQFGTSCCHTAASGGLCKERGEGAECPSFSLLPGGRTEEQARMGLLVLSLSPSPPFLKRRPIKADDILTVTHTPPPSGLDLNPARPVQGLPSCHCLSRSPQSRRPPGCPMWVGGAHCPRCRER